MKIIFCDSNIVFWIFRRICKNQTVNQSRLFDFSQNNEIYISDFVIAEVARNLYKKYDLSL